MSPILCYDVVPQVHSLLAMHVVLVYFLYCMTGGPALLPGPCAQPRACPVQARTWPSGAPRSVTSIGMLSV